jgi:molecular chaperone DnaK (HSP70)
MSLLQISDPTITNENLKKFVVGIDLGTTNSLIASYDSNLRIYQENSSKLIPSVVGIEKNNNILLEIMHVFNQTLKLQLSDQ